MDFWLVRENAKANEQIERPMIDSFVNYKRGLNGQTLCFSSIKRLLSLATT